MGEKFAVLANGNARGFGATPMRQTGEAHGGAHRLLRWLSVGAKSFHTPALRLQALGGANSSKVYIAADWADIFYRELQLHLGSDAILPQIPVLRTESFKMTGGALPRWFCLPT